MVVAYWIQRADHSSVDHDPVGDEAAVQAYQRHDWESELAFERELDASGAENCPPGIGFVAEPGHLLHVCPNVDTALVHYHFEESRKLLGIFPGKRSRVISALSLPLAEVPDLVRLFASGQTEAVRGRLEQAAARHTAV